MRFCFVRPTADFGGDIHYSGGNHGFKCAAETLAAAGHDVHVLYCTSKPQLMYELMVKGCMSQLHYSQAAEGVAVFTDQGITYHLGLLDAEQSTQDQLSRALAQLGTGATACEPTLAVAMQRIMAEVQFLYKQSTRQQGDQQTQFWVILDADCSQQPMQPETSTLMEACCHYIDPKRVLLFVQNIHFLPIGPAGTAPRSPGLLAAWGRVGGIICCSQFVAKYILEYARPLGIRPEQVTVAHYATWNAFGLGPFPNYGESRAQELPCSIQQASSQAQQQPAVIGCLKLLPEKGSQLFLSLAQQLPHLRFLAVCADSQVQQQAAALGLPNLRLSPPAADVNSILQHVTLLLAPSLWQEAYGMVVTEAVLRGVPVLVSNQGGLPEAALGAAAAVLPVTPMSLPTDASGCPMWLQRQFSAEQPTQQWVDAIQQVLGSRERYASCSEAGRHAGQQLLQQQPALMQQFLVWLEQLVSQR